MFRAFPLLFIAIAFYALLTFGGGMFAHHDMHTFMDREIMNIGLISQDRWSFKVGDAYGVTAHSLLLFALETAKQ